MVTTQPTPEIRRIKAEITPSSSFLTKYDPHGSGECGKCMEQFSADPHGKDCSCNPVAFSPSIEVRCGECGKCMEQFSAHPSMDINVDL